MGRNIDDLKKLALFKRQTFHRTVATEVYQTDEGALSLAKLHDNYHDMELALLVDPKTRKVVDVAARMNRYPFETCVHALDTYRRLVGLDLTMGGILHRVHQLIPRADGCTHLYTMLEACLRALFIGAGYEELKGRTTSDSRSDSQERLREHPMTRDTCVSFRVDGKFPEAPETFLARLREKDQPVPMSRED
jgi:hypothetical protein